MLEIKSCETCEWNTGGNCEEPNFVENCHRQATCFQYSKWQPKPEPVKEWKEVK